MKPYTIPEKVYAGVGNRDAPYEALWLGTEIAKILSDNGYTSRQGGAGGMDRSFLAGSLLAETYPPWHNFEGFPQLYKVPVRAYTMAEDIIGARWKRMPPGQRVMHARNMQEVLGPHLESPVKFLICYTRDGCDSEKTYTAATGGTGTAIVCADRKGIPVINLYHDSWAEHLTMFSDIDFMELKEDFLKKVEEGFFKA